MVAEQANSTKQVPFNKGRLINTAVKHALANYQENGLDEIDCFVLHDVDLIPIGLDKVDYRCHQMPLHLSNKVIKRMENGKEESVQYNRFLTGGALSLRPGHLIGKLKFCL